MPAEDAVDGTGREDAQSSFGFLDCVLFDLNINPVEACCHGFLVMHQQFVQVFLHSGAGLQHANEQKNINRLPGGKKNQNKNECNELSGEESLLWHFFFGFYKDRRLAGHIKESHKLFSFPETPQEHQNS